MSLENKTLNNCNGNSIKGSDTLKVAHATWTQEDRVQELDEIIQGAAHPAVEEKFQKFVEENIEPTGWQAIWRAQTGAVISTVKIENPLDFLVDVAHVSQELLKASVIVKEVITHNIDEIDISTEEITGKEVSVLLVQLYPTFSQENEVIDINTTTEVLEHLRFFYQHIELPWDPYDEICHYKDHLLQSRIKTYEDIQAGIIPRNVALEMESLKERGKKIGSEIVALEEDVSLSPDMEYDQFHVVKLMKLMKQMDFMKKRYEALKDPVLRELSAHEQQLERKYIMTSTFFDEPSVNLLLVASSVEINEFIKCVTELPNILNTLPQIIDFSKIRTFPSLQVALDSAQQADCIALLPGVHYMNSLGSLSLGGTILGVGDGVEIRGLVEAGDVLMDVKAEAGFLLLLQSITLKPVSEQAAISIRSGKVFMDRCQLIGGSVGIIVRERSECKIKNSTFSEQEKFAVNVGNEARLILDGAKFDDCKEAAILGEKYSNISATNDTQISNCKLGIKMLVPHEESPKCSNFQPLIRKELESIPFIYIDCEENFKHIITKF